MARKAAGLGRVYDQAIAKKFAKGRVRKKKWSWGGARPGAGRPKSAESGVPHKPRPKVNKRTEVTLVYLFSSELDLKNRKRLRIVQQVIDTAMKSAQEQRDSFNITGWRISWGERGALLAVEGHGAASTEELSRAAQGLGVRVARRTNAALERRGKVFADRYDIRVL